MIPAPSCLGKLPLHGDFLRIRVNQMQKVKLDQWFATLQKSSNAKHTESESKKSTETEQTQPWCFVMRGSLLGASNQLLGIGVLFDSSDKIGRRYPFVMYQLVPKRWLVNQLKEPNHWLACLHQLAKACLHKDNSEIDAMLKELWSIYKPQWLGYFRTPSQEERQRIAYQTEQVLQRWKLKPSVKSDVSGVIHAPWADWPRNLTMKKHSSIWWQLDDKGRYLDFVEHHALDRTLLEQLLGRT
jgi:type VI secretion system ImpM family protein